MNALAIAAAGLAIVLLFLAFFFVSVVRRTAGVFLKRKCDHLWVAHSLPRLCVKTVSGEDTYSACYVCFLCPARRLVIERADWHFQHGSIKPTGHYRNDWFAWVRIQGREHPIKTRDAQMPR